MLPHPLLSVGLIRGTCRRDLGFNEEEEERRKLRDLGGTLYKCAYAVSGWFFSQLGFSLAAALVSTLLLLPEALLLLQGQCDPQRPRFLVLLLDSGTVQ